MHYQFYIITPAEKYLEGRSLEDDRWRHSLGDQTRILGDKDFPVPKDWECSGKVLTEAAKVVETGSQGGVERGKNPVSFYNLLLDVLLPLRNQ